jgi:hypothetical protein
MEDEALLVEKIQGGTDGASLMHQGGILRTTVDAKQHGATLQRTTSLAPYLEYLAGVEAGYSHIYHARAVVTATVDDDPDNPDDVGDPPRDVGPGVLILGPHRSAYYGTSV